MTNAWAAELFAKSIQYRDSFGTNTGELGRSLSGNFGGSQTVDYEVLPREFGLLKKGGPAHRNMVEAFVHQSGRVWKSSRRVYERLLFPQG